MSKNPDSEELEQLLARIALQDEGALEKLYLKVAPKLIGVATVITNDTDLSNDAVQEAFVQIWSKASEYRRDLSEPITWINSLVRYRALDKLKIENRARKRQQQQDEAQLLFENDASNSPVTAVLQREANIGLHNCLQTLDTLNRNAILMAYFYGYSRQDIAIHLDKPVNTVKVWLNRGLRRLAKCLHH